jgi:acetylornithine deacetylase
MFCGHVDTVGVDGMDAPFTPDVRGDRLYGRGSQDMKGGVAAMIDAAAQVAARGLEKGRLIVAAVVDEEYASIGADALVTEWNADGAVVTEPTDLEIAVGHKGFAWLDVETRGRAAHGSRPKDGRDAIMRMGRMLQRLEALDRDLQQRAPHPLLGTGSLHASIINGGRELSSYPDRCRLQLERRTVVGESSDDVLRDVEDMLAALTEEDREFDGRVTLTFARPPYELAADHPLPHALARAAATTHTRQPNAPLGAMSFWTDAAVLASAGIPSVLFGPGGAGLHSKEEYVNVADVIACRDTLRQLVNEWC